jgi:hypothetical protein
MDKGLSETDLYKHKCLGLELAPTQMFVRKFGHEAGFERLGIDFLNCCCGKACTTKVGKSFHRMDLLVKSKTERK